MESTPTPSLAYRFNEALYLLEWKDGAPHTRYFHPGAEVLPFSDSRGEGAALLWQPEQHRAATLPLPASGESDLRSGLSEAFGGEAANLRYLAFTPDGSPCLDDAASAVVFALEATEIARAEALAEQLGLSKPRLFLPWQPALRSLQERGRGNALILNIGLEDTLLIVMRDASVESTHSLTWSLKSFGESLREILNLRFAGSGIRLLFNGVYDFSQNEDAIAEALIAALLPTLEKVIPDFQEEPLSVAVTGLPPGTEWICERLAARLNATPLVSRTGYDGMTTVNTQPALKGAPFPIAAFLAHAADGGSWLNDLKASTFPLDGTGSIALRSARLSDEEVAAFSKPDVTGAESGATDAESDELAPARQAPAERRDALPNSPANGSPAPAGKASPSSRKGLLFAAATVGTLALLGGGAWFILGGNSSSGTTLSQTHEVAPAAMNEAAADGDRSLEQPEADESLASSAGEADAGSAIGHPASLAIAPEPSPGAAEELAASLAKLSEAEIGFLLELPALEEALVERLGSTGSISVRAEPVGARIFLNDEPAGSSPLSLKDLEPGEYLLRFEAHGYRPEERFVTVTEDALVHSLEDIQLQRRTGDALIASEPAGVSFTLSAVNSRDFRPLHGTTPFDASALPEGSYRVLFERAGWPSRIENLEIAEAETVNLNYRYPEGSLAIVSVPAGATVLDASGEEVGRTPLEIEHLPEGDYPYTLTYPGREDAPLVVSVDAFEHSEVSAELIDLNAVLFGEHLDALPGILDDRVSRLIRSRAIDGDSLLLEVVVTLDREGRVESVGFLSEQPEALLEQARRIVEEMRFSPGLRKGNAVRSRAIVPLAFYRESHLRQTAEQLLAFWQPVLPYQD